MMQCVRPQPLLDASLPEDVEEGGGNDSPTYTIGAALDHIGRPGHFGYSLIERVHSHLCTRQRQQGRETPNILQSVVLLIKTGSLIPAAASSGTVTQECMCRLWAIPCDAPVLLRLRMGCRCRGNDAALFSRPSCKNLAPPCTPALICTPGHPSLPCALEPHLSLFDLKPAHPVSVRVCTKPCTPSSTTF